MARRGDRARIGGMMETLMTNLATLKADFDRDGYVIAKNVISQHEVDGLRDDIDALLEEKGNLDTIIEFGAAFKYANVLKLVENETILPIVVNLLGFNIQLHLSNLNLKRPLKKYEGLSYAGGKPVAGRPSASISWHRDGPSPQFPFVQDFSVKVCYFLSDLSEPDRGNTKVIPGSHRDRGVKLPHSDAIIPVTGEVQICGNPGDAMIFTQNLWHSASFNRSQIERRLAFVGYSAAWVRPADYQKAPQHILDQASPSLRQLLGGFATAPHLYYMPDTDALPLKSLWQGEQPTSAYAL